MRAWIRPKTKKVTMKACRKLTVSMNDNILVRCSEQGNANPVLTIRNNRKRQLDAFAFCTCRRVSSFYSISFYFLLQLEVSVDEVKLSSLPSELESFFDRSLEFVSFPCR